MQEYITNENGEKVLIGTRRPDGTLRKERRIRAGYIPQDEQPVYESRGMMARANIPKCPGLDPGQASGAAAAAAKSKAAKKNEKRKAKKAETGDHSSPSSNSQAPPAAPRAVTQPAAAATTTAAAAVAPSQPAAAAEAGDDSAAVLDKQIKALSKKVRQCQVLVDRQSAGDVLSQQEQEKLGKMNGWQEEIKQLEHQLAKLTT